MQLNYKENWHGLILNLEHLSHGTSKEFFCGFISITPIIQLLHCLGRDMTWGEYTKIFLDIFNY